MSDRKALPIVHSGHNWIPPRKIILTDLFDPTDEYLVRWILFRTPWFGIQIHKIVRPDADRHLHNHPRPFWSMILLGGYEEECLDLKPGFNAAFTRHHGIGAINRMPVERYHSIRRIFGTKPTWTLVIVGKHTQDWGFLTEDGHIPCDNYPAYVDTHPA